MKRHACLTVLLLSAFSLFAAEPGNLNTQAFVTEAAQAGHAEVELGLLAQKNGRAPEVKSHGQQMVADHGKANAELATLAKSKGLAIPAGPSPQQKVVAMAMEERTGAEFDAAYIEQMVNDHEKAVALFTAATQSQDPQIRAFAQKTLPTLQRHKQMTDALHSGHR